MKKIFISLLIISTFSAHACEICGCGNGNFYMGLLPQFNRGFVETRYNYFTFNTKMTSDATQFSNTTYQTIELWGGYNISKKWQIVATLPYHINKEVSDDGMKDIKGLGDLTILSNYKVFEQKKLKNEKSSFGQEVWLGGGIKLATGDSHVDLNDLDNNVGTFNSKLGTGSYDFLLNAMYKMSVNDFGVVASAQYKMNGKNSDEFQFGNRFYASTFAFYRMKAGQFRIAPNVGILYEKSDANSLNSTKVADSGDNMISAALGLEFNINKVAVGYNVQIPISQNFANGQTTANTRQGVHLSFAF